MPFCQSRAMLIVASIALTLVLPAQSVAQSSPAPAEPIPYDCTNVDLAKVDDLLLTKEERIAKMDNSLQTSLDAYSQCVKNVQQAMATSAASGGGGNAGAEGKTGETAAMSGSEAPEQEQQQSTEPKEQESASRSFGSRSSQINKENVDPKDNDSIICQLLWDEIQAATGDKRKGFVQQYEDYKCKRSLTAL